MRALLRAIALTLCAVIALPSSPARAAFHFWDIKEIFSSADGTVQFIEFTCSSAPFEHFLDDHNLAAISDGVTVNYLFDHDLNTLQSTANRHFLAATAGFGALAGGVEPDYTISANFFNPNAASIRINFASGTDQVTFAGSLLPKDGVMSLTDQSPAGAANLQPGVNSPTNFAGAAGSINVGGTTPSAGDFDEDGAVDADDLAAWQTGYGMQGAAVDHADGDADGDSDVDGGDFLIWQQELGPNPVSPAASVVPEPATHVLISAAALTALGRLRTRRQCPVP